jgi:hypothetical protein
LSSTKLYPGRLHRPFKTWSQVPEQLLGNHPTPKAFAFDPGELRALRRDGECLGLCGGMASAALDYFLSCIPIPSTTAVPASGTPLFSYLLRRQIDSLGGLTFAVVPRFLAWTNLPDTRPTGILPGLLPGASLIQGLQELTVPEFRATVASVTAGSPVVLGLIYVGPGAINIWENHQVLAYGTSPVSSTVTDIKIYDPNYPGNDRVVIRCELIAGGSRVRCVEMGPGVGTKTVRGFFRMPYTRVTPPCLP